MAQKDRLYSPWLGTRATRAESHGAEPSSTDRTRSQRSTCPCGQKTTAFSLSEFPPFMMKCNDDLPRQARDKLPFAKTGSGQAERTLGIVAHPISLVTTGSSLATGSTARMKLSNVEAKTDAPGYSARTASSEAMTSSAEGGEEGAESVSTVLCVRIQSTSWQYDAHLEPVLANDRFPSWRKWNCA